MKNTKPVLYKNMADFTNLFQGQLTGDFGKPDFFNIFYILTSLYVISSLSFSALRVGELPVIIIAIVYMPLFLIGFFASRGGILLGESSILEGAAGYTMGALLTSLLTTGGFSFFSTPSESYLSSILAEANPYIVEIVNKYLAGLENLFFIPVAAVSYLFVNDYTDIENELIKISLASIVPILGFAILHGGGRSPAFLALAASVAYLWIISIGFEDVKPGTQFPYIVGTFGFTIGSHHAFNSGGITGMYQFWQTLWTGVQEGVIGIDIWVAIAGFQILMLALGGFYIVRMIYRRLF
jgi:hypothetical protein